MKSPEGARLEPKDTMRSGVSPPAWSAITALALLVALLGWALARSSPQPTRILTQGRVFPAEDRPRVDSGDPETEQLLARLSITDLDRALFALAPDLQSGQREPISCAMHRYLLAQRRFFELADRTRSLRLDQLAVGVEMIQRLSPDSHAHIAASRPGGSTGER